MIQENTEDLGTRLLAAEKQLVQARDEIIALRNMVHHGKRARMAMYAALLVSIVLLLAWNRTPIVSAQGPWAHAGGQIVTAPFKVAAADGSPIFEVSEGTGNTGRNVILFNSGGNQVVQMFAFPGHDGQGKIQVRDGMSSGVKGGAVAMGADENGGAFIILDQNGKEVAAIGKKVNGAQGLSIYEPVTGTEVAQVLGRPDGGGQLSLYDHNLKGAHPFGVATIGKKTMLYLNDHEGKAVLKIEGSASSERGIQLSNSDGKKVGGFMAGAPSGGNAFLWVGAPNDDGGTAMLSINRNGKAGLYLSYKGTTPAVSLNSYDGLTLWEDGGKSAAALLSWGKRGGLLTIGNGQGEDVVEAGVTEDGRGLVKTGPYSGGQVPMQGLPTAIMGHK